MQVDPPPGLFINVNGLKIHYEKIGTGPKTLLLVPVRGLYTAADCNRDFTVDNFCYLGSLGSTRTDFNKQLETLNPENKYTLVSIDLPGWGYSRPPEKNFGPNWIENDCDFLYAFVKVLKLDPFYLIGWSGGGILSLIFAVKYPQFVKKMIIWGATTEIGERHVVCLKAFLDTSIWTAEHRGRFERVYGNNLPQLWANTVEVVKCGDKFYKDRIAEIKCPTLVIHSKGDFIDKNEIKYIIKTIPGCDQYYFDDGGHDIHISHTEEFNQIIKGFVDDE